MDDELRDNLVLFFSDNSLDDLIYDLDIDPIESVQALLENGSVSEKELVEYLLDEGYYDEEDEYDDE